MHYVVLNLLFRFYLDCGMILVKLHQAIRSKSLTYVASYIANDTAQRQQFKHDNVKKAIYKIMNNALLKNNRKCIAANRHMID